ncbi:ankyrin repeat and IBR domain-containing protein 1-like [Macrotis lagotis]
MVSSASLSVLHSSSAHDYTSVSRSENQDSLQALSSLDEDDPNILLAIQLSLQESGLSIDEETRDFLQNEASLGAIGTSLPTRLDAIPMTVDNPRAALSSSELLELGESVLRLSTDSNPCSADGLSPPPLNDARSEFYPTSSDPDSANQDSNLNENLLGNIMAWFHDMNPQTIALIPSAVPETSEDSQLPCAEGEPGGPLGPKVSRQGQPAEPSLPKDAGESHAQGPQSEERDAEESRESGSAAGIGAGSTACSTDPGDDGSGQTDETSEEWTEQVHLV